MNETDTMWAKTTNYPNNYNNNQQCYYAFYCTTANTKPKLVFTDFEVQSSTDCSKDVVIVKDGTNIHSPELARLCGPKSGLASAQFTASGQKMLINFKSDSTITDKGFKAKVTCSRKFVRCVIRGSSVIYSI